MTRSCAPCGRVNALYFRVSPVKFSKFRKGLLRIYARLVIVVLVSRWRGGFEFLVFGWRFAVEAAGAAGNGGRIRIKV